MKNLKASLCKPSIISIQPRGEDCQNIYAGTLAVETKVFMVLKVFPNVSHIGSTAQYNNIGESPTVTLYIYINHHAKTQKQKQRIL